MLAAARELGLSRPEKIEYARKRGIPILVTLRQPYSIDMNLWGRSIDCGNLEDPWQEPPEEIFSLTKSPAAAPDRESRRHPPSSARFASLPLRVTEGDGGEGAPTPATCNRKNMQGP